MKHLYTLILFLLLGMNPIFAQLDSIQQLDEVILSDSKLYNYSDGFSVIKLPDSIIQKNTYSLTELLQYNSQIYFKENGYGMVSSPSFRGTNAAQTAVIWNGISINSVLTGQTDFNTILPNSFDDVTIRSGGGSVQYGSGAIGGSIHLNNNVLFKKKTVSKLKLLYGSFSTLATNYKTVFSNRKTFLSVGVDFISSENDFDFIDLDRKNENGAFLNLNINTTFGLKLGKSVLKWQSNYLYGDRNFSSTITAPSNDRYKDVSTRNLVSWSYFSNNYSSILKAVHLYERFRYFPNKERLLFFEGKANSFIGDYTFDYFLNNNMKFSAIANFTRIIGEGSSIGENYRNTLSTVLLFNHKITKKLSYGINLRQEYLNDFSNPFLFSVDGKYQVNDVYALSFNASKNYRVPTFNDLFWNFGGNENLQPETSLQAEIGNSFSWKNIQLKISAYIIETKDQIKWVPGTSGFFSPVNISETQNYGLEVSTIFKKNFQNNQISLGLNYAYTSATDKEKDKQLIYVPFHKMNGIFGYSNKRFSANYQLLYNGKVFTTTDNKGNVEAYSISNVSFEYEILSEEKPISIGLKINNIYNTYYENVAFRPMPNRNFQLYLNLIF